MARCEKNIESSPLVLTLNLDSWFHVYESLWTTHNNGKWTLQLDQIQGAARFHGQENGKP